MARGFTLKLDAGLYTFGMPTALASQLVDDDESRLASPISVKEMRVIPDGFLFVIDPNSGPPFYELKYEPEDFAEFLKELGQSGVSRSALLSLDTVGASSIFKTFYEWMNHKLAELFERDIKAGKLTFEEARELRKEVFDIPAFADFFKASWLAGDMPKGKKGKRRSFNRNVEELYAFASRIYRENQGKSWEDACGDAIEQNPGLVPAGWAADPEGNLKREAARYWDKSEYSQLSYRKARDI
ncbi:hypothetical protein [uncultured Halopseudomonas sp.]|mgnify:CR=1 FL=1|uniref:hypothetical protein n=1 Tax=uncultured Halopseudomonas sp. TaxID=2901193 RepID=UPI0030EE62ED|tara:strand:+ start:59342 stop:60067 length:726 start_codon:yes stop_codon:yes gene_type:complete